MTTANGGSERPDAGDADRRQVPGATEGGTAGTTGEPGGVSRPADAPGGSEDMRDGEASGAGPAATPALRIGNAERESAAKALDAHLEAGRLGVEEYADRSAIAANAVTADELRALFTDLPAPYPELPGTAVRPAAGAVAEPDAATPAQRPFASWGPRLAAAAPIVALVLFFVLNGVVPNAWLVFLLIPLVGALGFHQSRGRDEVDRQERRELRHEQRALERDERRAGRERRRGDPPGGEPHGGGWGHGSGA